MALTLNITNASSVFFLSLSTVDSATYLSVLSESHDVRYDIISRGSVCSSSFEMELLKIHYTEQYLTTLRDCFYCQEKVFGIVYLNLLYTHTKT